jgi:uncharacterized protein (DUF2126 family)
MSTSEVQAFRAGVRLAITQPPACLKPALTCNTVIVLVAAALSV